VTLKQLRDGGSVHASRNPLISRMLVEAGIMVAKGQGRGASYRVSPELHETRAWLENRVPALRTFFGANSALKNADYRQVFGLAKAARVLGLAEEVGRGVDLMFREMISAGRDIPRIESHHDHVRVSLPGGRANTQVARFVARDSLRKLREPGGLSAPLEQESTSAACSVVAFRSNNH